IERAFADVSEYHQFVGCMVNSLSLNIAPNAMVTGSFGIIGKDVTIASSPLDAEVTAAAAHPPFDGFTGSISEGGGGVGNVTVRARELQNRLSPAFVIGSPVPRRILAGRATLTGNPTAVRECEALLPRFVLETESSLSLTLAGAGRGDLTIPIPRI